MNIRLISAAAIASLALAGCATSPSSGYGNGYGYGNAPPPSSSAACYDCGTVQRIDAVGTGTQGSNVTGAVLGGVVGAAAGRTLAKDESKGRRNTATVAGAAAGALAGSAIQRNMNDNTGYNITVRMNDGRVVTVSQGDLGGIREGSYVRVYDGRAWLQ
jgi:outer membrane lipoprotein SlyB